VQETVAFGVLGSKQTAWGGSAREKNFTKSAGMKAVVSP
jgi:hypothetical protein